MLCEVEGLSNFMCIWPSNKYDPYDSVRPKSGLDKGGLKKAEITIWEVFNPVKLIPTLLHT